MAMKIRIGILSGWPVPEIPEPCSREPWTALAWAQCQLITSSQSLPFNAIQSPPESQGNSFRGLQRLLLAISVAVYLFFQLLVPHARMVDVGSLMNGEVSAGLGIGTVGLQQASGLLLGDPRYLRLICVK